MIHFHGAMAPWIAVTGFFALDVALLCFALREPRQRDWRWLALLYAGLVIVVLGHIIEHIALPSGAVLEWQGIGTSIAGAIPALVGLFAGRNARQETDCALPDSAPYVQRVQRDFVRLGGLLATMTFLVPTQAFGKANFIVPGTLIGAIAWICAVGILFPAAKMPSSGV